MAAQFDHEKLRAYQEALRFAAWVGPVIESFPAKLAVRDQLDRASTSIALNIAEENGKRSHADRCRYLDIARGSALESAACLDVLVARQKLDGATASTGKEILLNAVSMLAGLIAHFSGGVREEQATYGTPESDQGGENEND